MLSVLLTAAAVSHIWSQQKGFQIAEIFPVETSHSYVGFSIRYMGYAMVRGRFTDFRGAVRYPKNLSGISVSFRIQVSSIDTGDEWRDRDLRSDNWFGSDTYPTITFTSKTVTVTQQGLLVTGELSIRDVTRTVTFPMNCSQKVLKDVRGDSQIVFTGELMINRIEFGVEGKKWAGIAEGITAVSDDVKIEISILAKRINAPNFRYWVADQLSPHGRIYTTAKAKGVKKALHEFDSLRSLPDTKVNDETLNIVGQMLLKENEVADAFTVFDWNKSCFQSSTLVYESCGEAEASRGNWAEAARYYKTALERDPDNMNAKEVLRHIEK